MKSIASFKSTTTSSPSFRSPLPLRIPRLISNVDIGRHHRCCGDRWSLLHISLRGLYRTSFYVQSGELQGQAGASNSSKKKHITVLVRSALMSHFHPDRICMVSNRCHTTFASVADLSPSILEVVHTICVCVLLYSLTVTNYGRPTTIVDAPWSLDLSVGLSAWIGAAIQVRLLTQTGCVLLLLTISPQAFFAYRVKVVSGSFIIPTISWGLALLRASFGVVLGVTAFRSKTLPHFIHVFRWLVITHLTVGVFTDLLNTVSMCFALLRRRSSIKMCVSWLHAEYVTNLRNTGAISSWIRL
jgi:hypothetical protein